MSTVEPRELPFDVAGVHFIMEVFPDPSGVRGKVWHQDEKIAGVRLFHSADLARLLEVARHDPAVLRAVGRLSRDAR